MNIAEFKNIPYGLPTKSFSCMVLGSRGSGKSQLIKKLCGIYMPQIEKENRFLFYYVNYIIFK
jgi:ABC-type cobalamin/Fe3+-siderophores transport system ATPase subunit